MFASLVIVNFSCQINTWSLAIKSKIIEIDWIDWIWKG